MAKIIFAMLPEAGHLLPTYKLAKDLKARGHDVCFVTARYCEKELRAEGFDRISGFEELWQTVLDAGASGLDDANRIILDFRTEIVRVLRRAESGLIVVDGFLPAMGLIALEHGFPAVLLHTNLQAMPKLIINSSLFVGDDPGAAALSSLKIVEMVLCPREFEFTRSLANNRTRYYIEPSVALERNEPPFSWGRIDNDRPLIYCSLGSQSRFFEEGRNFLQVAIDALAARQDWQMVLSIGNHLTAGDFRDVPPNVELVNWAPQLTLLKRASIMITHGGLGTIKECILLGVPMIVFPLMRDQPRNAARVVYHGLGLRGDLRQVSVEQLRFLIGKIDSDPSFKMRMETMRDSFLEAEAAGKGVKIIEKILAVIERTQPKRSTVSAN